jgi:predicted N-formylglutamate amidohydrolase
MDIHDPESTIRNKFGGDFTHFEHAVLTLLIEIRNDLYESTQINRRRLDALSDVMEAIRDNIEADI